MLYKGRRRDNMKKDKKHCIEHLVERRRFFESFIKKLNLSIRCIISLNFCFKL